MVAGLRGALAATLALGLFASPASAHIQERRDSRNGENPLDIRKVASWHNANNMFFYVETYAAWRNSALGRHGDLWFTLDPRGPARYVLWIYKKRNGYLGMNVSRYINGEYHRVGAGSVPEAGDTWVTVRVRRTLIEARNGRQIGWWAGSAYTSSGLCQNGCRDETSEFWHPL